MKKTLNLSIGGALFSVEEDAFEKLDSYIGQIRTHFEGNPDRDEILADIEGRIAEKFSEKNNPIITIADVNVVIEAMGTIDQFETENSESGESAKITKKLYRDHDTAIIAGVSSGLGYYFDVNPLIFRFLFLISIFLGGTGVIVYAILWILVPEAKTPSQKLSMRGSKVTISAMADILKEKINEMKSPRDKNLFAKILAIPLDILRALVHFIQKAIFPSIRVLLGAIILIGSLTLAVGATIAASFSIFGISSTFIEGPLLATLQSPLAHLLSVALYIVVLIPLILIGALGVRFISKKSPIGKVSTISLLGAWFIAIAISGGAGSKLGMQATQIFQNDPYYKSETQVVEMGKFTKVAVTDNQNVRLLKGDMYKLEVKGRTQDISSMIFTNATGTLVIERTAIDHGPCIVCRQGYVDVIITAPSLSSIMLDDSSFLFGDITGDSLFIDIDNGSSANLDITLNTLDIRAQDSSTLRLNGATTALTAQIKNSSRIEARNLEIGKATVEASNGSSVIVYVKDSLNAVLTNASRILYAGTPDIIKKVDNSSQLESVEGNN